MQTYYIREDEVNDYYIKFSNVVCEAKFSFRDYYEGLGYVDIYEFIIYDKEYP